MLFGGREAEIIKFGPEKVTSGASGDIQMATNLARSMVMEWGMSEKLGRVRYKSNDQEVFLGHSVTQSQHMSDDTARIIDQEVRKLIEDGEASAKDILTTYHDEWEAIAQALLEFETLTGDELRARVCCEFARSHSRESGNLSSPQKWDSRFRGNDIVASGSDIRLWGRPRRPFSIARLSVISP